MENLKASIETVCDCEYPVGIQEIKEKCGDSKIKLKNGDTTTLTDMLNRVKDNPEVFDSEQELYNYILCYAPEGSIGRKNYDDRGSNPESRTDVSL